MEQTRTMTPVMEKKIGNTTYIISFIFSNTEQETITDKMERLMKKELEQEVSGAK